MKVKKTKLPFTVSCIALSVDDKLLAVGGADNNVHIFAVGDELKVSQVSCCFVVLMLMSRSHSFADLFLGGSSFEGTPWKGQCCDILT